MTKRVATTITFAMSSGGGPPSNVDRSAHGSLRSQWDPSAPHVSWIASFRTLKSTVQPPPNGGTLADW